MTRRLGIVWHLRMRMAEKGLFHTSDLVPLLAERGVALSREQVYRLVTAAPQRLSMDILAALCDILDVAPNDLIEVTVVNARVRKTAAGAAGRGGPGGSGGSGGSAPRKRTTIRRPDTA